MTDCRSSRCLGDALNYTINYTWLSAGDATSGVMVPAEGIRQQVSNPLSSSLIRPVVRAGDQKLDDSRESGFHVWYERGRSVLSLVDPESFAFRRALDSHDGHDVRFAMAAAAFDSCVHFMEGRCAIPIFRP